MAKSLTIRSPSTGLTRRTFKAKEWLVITQQDEESRCDMLTFETEEKAKRACDGIGRRFAPLVHYVERAAVA